MLGSAMVLMVKEVWAPAAAPGSEERKPSSRYRKHVLGEQRSIPQPLLPQRLSQYAIVLMLPHRSSVRYLYSGEATGAGPRKSLAWASSRQPNWRFGSTRPLPITVVWLDYRFDGKKDLDPGCDRGAKSVNQARATVNMFSGSNVVSPTPATSAAIPLRDRIDAPPSFLGPLFVPRCGNRRGPENR